MDRRSLLPAVFAAAVAALIAAPAAGASPTTPSKPKPVPGSTACISTDDEEICDKPMDSEQHWLRCVRKIIDTKTGVDYGNWVCRTYAADDLPTVGPPYHIGLHAQYPNGI